MSPWSASDYYGPWWVEDLMSHTRIGGSMGSHNGFGFSECNYDHNGNGFDAVTLFMVGLK